VGILRIETDFGRDTGNYPLVNSFLTLALIENRRSSWSKHDPEKNRQAVWAYNHCDSYVKAVFAYARALKTVR